MATIKDASTKLNEYLKTSEHRSYFLIFVTLLFVIVMVVLGILPAYSAFTAQGQENAKRQVAIDKLSSKLNTLKQLTEEAQSKEDLIKYFDFVFPSKPDQDLILNELMDMSDNSNVYLKELNFKENKELKKDFPITDIQLPENLKAQLISIKFEGSQSTINRFLKELEEKRRIYNVRNIGITRKSDQEIVTLDQSRYYDLVINLNIYYFDESVVVNL